MFILFTADTWEETFLSSLRLAKLGKVVIAIVGLAAVAFNKTSCSSGSCSSSSSSRSRSSSRSSSSSSSSRSRSSSCCCWCCCCCCCCCCCYCLLLGDFPQTSEATQTPWLLRPPKSMRCWAGFRSGEPGPRRISCAIVRLKPRPMDNRNPS